MLLRPEQFVWRRLGPSKKPSEYVRSLSSRSPGRCSEQWCAPGLGATQPASGVLEAADRLATEESIGRFDSSHGDALIPRPPSSRGTMYGQGDAIRLTGMSAPSCRLRSPRRCWPRCIIKIIPARPHRAKDLALLKTDRYAHQALILTPPRPEGRRGSEGSDRPFAPHAARVPIPAPCPCAPGFATAVSGRSRLGASSVFVHEPARACPTPPRSDDGDG